VAPRSLGYVLCFTTIGSGARRCTTSARADVGAAGRRTKASRSFFVREQEVQLNGGLDQLVDRVSID
jgi:hypothetical protein